VTEPHTASEPSGQELVIVGMAGHRNGPPLSMRYDDDDDGSALLQLANGYFRFAVQPMERAVPVDYTTACATLTSQRNDITDGRCHSDHHSRVHRVFTDSEHIHQRWQCDWTRDQCVTVAQLGTGHSPLLAAYLRRIRRRDSATCLHCNGAEELPSDISFASSLSAFRQRH